MHSTTIGSPSASRVLSTSASLPKCPRRSIERATPGSRCDDTDLVQYPRMRRVVIDAPMNRRPIVRHDQGTHGPRDLDHSARFQELVEQDIQKVWIFVGAQNPCRVKWVHEQAVCAGQGTGDDNRVGDRAVPLDDLTLPRRGAVLAKIPTKAGIVVHCRQWVHTPTNVRR